MITNEIENRLSEMESRLAFSENRYKFAMRKMKVQSLLGLTALGITFCFSSIPHAMAQGYGTSLSTLISDVKALQTQQTTDVKAISSLQSQQSSISQSCSQMQNQLNADYSEISQLVEKTSYLSSTNAGLTIDAPSITLEDNNTPNGAAPTQLVMQGSNVNIISANLGIEDGLGGAFSISESKYGQLLRAQEPVNGLGNLIIGYNSNGSITGSHNLIMGDSNNASSFGAIVSGLYNSSSAPFSTVLNGFQNNSISLCSTILGGQGNNSTGNFSLIADGVNNVANGAYSSVVDGYTCTADDIGGAILGGYNYTLNTGGLFTFYP